MMQLDDQSNRQKHADTIMLKLNYSVIHVWNEETFL